MDFSAAGLKLHTDGNYYYAQKGIIKWGYSGTASAPDGTQMTVKNGVAVK